MQTSKRLIAYYCRRVLQVRLHLDRRIVIIFSVLAFVALFASLPLFMKTKTYPFTIVEGNSMYPNLQNGDLVIFHSVPEQTIANGTIIVFVQGQTGITMLDSLIRPVVIHRVVDILVQDDGLVNYRTKGDNNQENDPELVKSMQVLGTPIQVIPKVGILLLFLRSSQGMVTVIGFITLLYLGNYETKIKQEKRQSDFLGALAQMVLNADFPEELFNKIEIAVKYIDNLQMDQLKDRSTSLVVDWISRGGLENKWALQKVICPECGFMATKFESGKDLYVTVCGNCDARPQDELSISERESLRNK